jgi:NAD(P)-dependent dehydrogenase (short-subunit alcohol dehydrogenase family)
MSNEQNLINPSAAPASHARFPRLHGRSVFVTGGGSGIGAAIVEAFARQGARVAFIDVAEGPSAALAARIAADGFAAPWWRPCDVRDVAALQDAIAQASAELGDFHALVNNVASDARHDWDQVTLEYYDHDHLGTFVR